MAWMAVADDLTGAADLAGVLARPGAPVHVAGVPDALRGLGRASRVLDAATRFLRPGAARQAVRAAWAGLEAPVRGPLWRYQKIDSTLRGNPGPELEGFLLATSAPWVAVLPAYPSLGRQVLGGRLKVRGRDLMESEYARDPLSPARTAQVAALVPPGLAWHANLGLVRRGSRALSAWIRRRPSRARFVSFDCAEARQVGTIAQACLRAGGRHFAGASGLAAALARRLQGPAVAPAPPRAPWCMVLGSVSATAFAQLEQGAKDGAFVWQPMLERQGRRWRRPGRIAWMRLKGRLRSGGHVALSSLACRADLEPWRAEGRRRGLDPLALAERSLRDLARRALGLGPGCAWFLAGGHTLEVFLRRAGLRRLEVLGQILPGVPLSRAHGPGGERWVASRPGGFGEVRSLIHLVGRRSGGRG